VLEGDAVFVPDDVPRRGVLALWGTGSGTGRTGKVELVFASAYGLRKRLVTARLLSVAEALPELLSIDPNATGPAGQVVRPTLGVWAAAATAGVGLVARGRLLPTVGPGGTDAWRIGPLDAADLAWLRELSACFPPAAHALAIPGTRPMRIRSAESLVRAFWDAIADTLVRTAAAPRVVASSAFAAQEPTPVGDLAEWLADTTEGLAAGARLGLRIEAAPAPRPDIDAWDDETDPDWPGLDANGLDANGLDEVLQDGDGLDGNGPNEVLQDGNGLDEILLDGTSAEAGLVPAENGQDGAGSAARSATAPLAAPPALPALPAPPAAPPAFRLVLQLRSTADPSLIVDASSLWDQPGAVLARFGTQAETDLLLALRRGAAVWPPLEPCCR
jgi:hypothetical protein